MKARIWGIALVCAGLVSTAQAELGLFFSYQDTKDCGDGIGAGLKYEIPVRTWISVDSRASMAALDLNAVGEGWTQEFDLIPVELNVNLKYPGDRIVPYMGVGVGYYFFYPDNFKEEVGYNIHAGVNVGVGGDFSFFAEVKYLFLTADGTDVLMGASHAYDIDLDGVGAIAGLLVRF